MATKTTKLGLNKPGHSEKGWDYQLNDNADIIDQALGTEHHPDGRHAHVHADRISSGTQVAQNDGEIAADLVRLPGGTVTGPSNITGQSLAVSIDQGAEADLAAINGGAGQPRFALTNGTRDLFVVDKTRGLAGMLGNIASPLVDLPLDQIELMPFAAATASAAIPAATDVAGWVGLLRTVAVTFTAVPDGVAAGQYAIINGEQYPITATTATTVTLEYSALLADPTGTPVVQFAIWRFAGKYRGLSNYSHASRRTYIDPLTGRLTGAPAGFPAFERMADGRIGLLHEGSSTNYLLDSRDPTTANWTKVEITGALATGVAAPDGTTTCYTLTDTATPNATHYIEQLGVIPAGAQTTYAIVKAGTHSEAFVQISNATDGIVALAYFDLVNGVVASTSAGTAKIKPLANGWYWCEVSGTGTVASNAYVGHALNGAMAYTGTGTGTIYFWHAQGEPVSFGTSVIPTGATTVTRAVDILSIPMTGNYSGVGNNPFTVLMDVHLLGDNVGNYQRFVRLNGNCNWLLYLNPGGNGQLRAGFNLSGTGASIGANINDGMTHRIGVVSDGVKGYLWQDAVRTATNALMDTTTIPATTNVIGIGSSGNGNSPIYGHISNVHIWDIALNDIESAAA